MLDEVKHFISSDLSAADLKISLFNAALNSYRFDSVLNPYPSTLMNPSSKEEDVKKLVDQVYFF